MRAAVLDRKKLTPIRFASSSVTQKWVQRYSFIPYSSPLPPLSHEAAMPTEKAQTALPGYRTVPHYTSARRAVESLGTWTNHLSLSWDIFNCGEIHALLFDSLKGDFLHLQRLHVFPLTWLRGFSQKQTRWEVQSSFPQTRWWVTSPSEQPHCIPSTILKQPEGKLFANNAVPLGRGLTLSTANRGLVLPASSPNFTLTSWLSES